MITHATYKVSYRGIKHKETEASRDAIQLLKMFAFFYFKNIRADILKRAVLNREDEKRLETRRQEEKARRPRTWSQTFRTTSLTIFTFAMQNQGPPALSYLIHNGRDSGSFNEVRLWFALRELVQ